jgi:hypothetical protein
MNMTVLVLTQDSQKWMFLKSPFLSKGIARCLPVKIRCAKRWKDRADSFLSGTTDAVIILHKRTLTRGWKDDRCYRPQALQSKQNSISRRVRFVDSRNRFTRKERLGAMAILWTRNTDKQCKWRRFGATVITATCPIVFYCGRNSQRWNEGEFKLKSWSDRFGAWGRENERTLWELDRLYLYPYWRNLRTRNLFQVDATGCITERLPVFWSDRSSMRTTCPDGDMENWWSPPGKKRARADRYRQR